MAANRAGWRLARYRGSPGRGGASTGAASTPACSAIVVSKSFTDVSRPVPMLHTSPPPFVAARTKASTTSST